MKRGDWAKIFADLPPGLTLKQIARRLGRSYRVTAMWATRMGYRPGSGRKLLWTAQRRRQFARVPWDRIPWRRLKDTQIGRAYGVSRQIVNRRRKEYAKR